MNAPNDTYTHGHSEAVLRSHRWRTAANSAAYLLPHLRPSDVVLDVGCGPGTISVELAGLVPAGRVVGLDRAAEIVVAATDHAAGQGATNIEFRAGDVYALDFADDTFDVVHAHQVLQHLSDPVAALGEMRRVCRPGGLIAVRDADYAAMTWFPASDALARWLAIYDAVARGNNAEPNAGRHLLSWAQAAGLTNVVPSASAWCYATEQDRTWWCGLWADRLLSSDFGVQAVAGGHSTPSELDSLADSWRTWGANTDGWFSVLHGEILARP
ncbi:MAG TPA: methyltransferase domain-containing protein [Ilumatobacteraceae bacterium]